MMNVDPCKLESVARNRGTGVPPVEGSMAEATMPHLQGEGR
jgi:hypothetical protein